MYEIVFYEDRKGNSPVRDYTNKLALGNDKNSRIKFRQIKRHIQFLTNCGTRIGEPVVKHVRGEIWELRPLRDRILFAAWVGDSFVLLHQFLKDTQKTPVAEIEKAENELADFKERFG
ncbi:MAG: type II toxin-antitoxin system RelE/ParE family toxin [Selenomonadaceae bacterium]|nr:type II toxin-antitoxin system RelE/ParE family toxin [Selenomonadaceae bacterium]